MPNHYVFKACIILQILSVTLAFVGGKQRSIFQRSHHHHHGLTPLFPRCQQQRPIVSMSMDEFPEGNAPEGNMPEGTEAPTKDPSESTSAAVSSSEPTANENSYPLDVPSPILLSSSMVLAIVGTGSLFELLGGSPLLGFIPTAAIALVGLPLCLFLFYAAILKAKAETEEDDRDFLNK